MPLRHLEVRGLRNLGCIKLEDCGRINILSGANGSGKTSLLEAIYFLGLGRSFRSSRLTPLIGHKVGICTVYGEVIDGSGRYQSLGISRSRQGKQELHINKGPASIAELATVLPLQLINADSFALIEGSPKARRQFMDWGVFHVKPTFLDYWRKAQRCLKQRNYLLRRHKLDRHARARSPELMAWDKELDFCSTYIDQLRAEYVDNIQPLFRQILRRVTELPEVSLQYQRGWKADIDLYTVLEEGFETDIKLGSTAAGPHRANIDIRIGGLPAVDVLSRGQLKLVVSSLRLAQGSYLNKHESARCIYLIDDLTSELDKEHRSTLCRLLDEIGCQVFITSVDADTIENDWLNKKEVRRFHVKQGQISATKI